MPIANIFYPYLNTSVCIDETVVTDAYWEHTSMDYVIISVKRFSEQLTKFSFQALSQNFEKRLLASSCLSIRPSAWYNLAPTGRIFFQYFSKICRENSNFIKTWKG